MSNEEPGTIDEMEAHQADEAVAGDAPGAVEGAEGVALTLLGAVVTNGVERSQAPEGAGAAGEPGDEATATAAQPSEQTATGSDDVGAQEVSKVTGEELGLRDGSVTRISMNLIDATDETFRFRAALRTGPLKASLQREGQQVPIVVRPLQGRPKKKRRRASDAKAKPEPEYQLVSGFRRFTAAQDLKWTTIAAVVREMDERTAFHASVLENTHRKTYSDIDRASAIRDYQAKGYPGIEIAELMGLTSRHKNNLLGLLELPEAVQLAIDDKKQHFGTTHALMLKRARNKYPQLDYAEWVARVNGEELSVAALTRALNKRFKKPAASTFTGIFRDDDTDAEGGVFRLAPVKLEVAKMSDADKARLRAELKQLLAKL